MTAASIKHKEGTMKLRYIKPGDTFTINGRRLVFVVC